MRCIIFGHVASFEEKNEIPKAEFTTSAVSMEHNLDSECDLFFYDSAKVNASLIPTSLKVNISVMSNCKIHVKVTLRAVATGQANKIVEKAFLNGMQISLQYGMWQNTARSKWRMAHA